MKKIIALTACLITNIAFAAMSIPDLPTPTSTNLKDSNVYTAQVKQGSGNWQTLHVKMSESQDELVSSNYSNMFKDRTFNFVPFSFNQSEGEVTIRVTKQAGKITESITTNAGNVEVVGADSSLIKIDNHTVEFKLNSPKYVSVKFDTNSNTKKSGSNEAVKHMLMIFADPKNNDLTEPQASAGETKVVYSAATSYQDLVDADIIVFRSGFHDIRTRGTSYTSNVSWRHGAIPVTNNTKVWFHPQAVVAGHITAVDSNGDNYKQWSVADNVEIYGRGLLYMGDFRNNPSSPNTGIYWRPGGTAHTSTSSPYMFEAIGLNGGENSQLRGIMIGDIMWHGVVLGHNSTVDRAKIWGWHGNNDSFRPHNGSVVKNSFLRPVDDSFYAFDITLEDNLIWPSYNGGFITCGWAGKYNTGGIEANNTTIIYPEWNAIGNNNGIVMSQIGDYQECDGITINKMDIYGDPIAILNLKPSSVRANSVWWSGASSNPGVRNIAINDLTVHGKQKVLSKIETDNIYKVTGVTFNNLKITGYKTDNLTNSDRTAQFTGTDITNNSVLNISSGGGTTPPASSNYFYLENVSFNERLKSTDGATSLDLTLDTGDKVIWSMQPTDNGYFYLENKSYGERLKAADGATSFDLTMDTGNKVQWKKVDAGNGNFYLESRAYPGERLKAEDGATNFNTDTNTGSKVQWRFIEL